MKISQTHLFNVIKLETKFCSMKFFPPFFFFGIIWRMSGRAMSGEVGCHLSPDVAQCNSSNAIGSRCRLTL